MNSPIDASWPEWQRAYRYGAVVIEPPRELASVLDAIRERLDPVSAGRVGAHITVTPPLRPRRVLPMRSASPRPFAA